MYLPVLTEENVKFLREITEAVLAASYVQPGQELPVLGRNRLGFSYVSPGGYNCYPSFWTRDYVMSLECGVIPEEIAQVSFLCLAQHQAREELHFKSGAIVPEGSIPDHIRPDGLPIYFPGTYNYAEQGGKTWGMRPAFDGSFFFIENAFRMKQLVFADYQDQLEAAFRAVPVEKEGLLVECTEETRGVNFGFTDAVVHTGKLLFSSLLRCRAARHLATMFANAGDNGKAEQYQQLSRRISAGIEQTFVSDCGLLKASAGCSCQPDVWGSAFAVYHSLVSPECCMRISKTIAEELRSGTIAWKGQICHVPTDHAARPDSPWERTFVRKNCYQNGAYWGTATGWVAYAAALSDPDEANRLLTEYLADLRENDFRKGAGCGAPWECVHPDGNYRQNAVYLTSVSCPYAAVLKLQKESRNTARA